MNTARQKAFGKLNLTLDVLGKRPDGYHDMRMVMQTVSLCDDVTVTLTDDGKTCTCDNSRIPVHRENLAMQAAEIYLKEIGAQEQGYAIHIEKRIPMQGGMAGGSADAAAVLRAMDELFPGAVDRERLFALAAMVGSDVPYCLLGGTALAEGRGEILTKLPPVPRSYAVLVKPEFSVSTPKLFSVLDTFGIKNHPDTSAAVDALHKGDLPALCQTMVNVFQPVLEQDYPVIGEICHSLRAMGAMGACLTGTGSVVFGVFDREKEASSACKTMEKRGFLTFLTEMV